MSVLSPLGVVFRSLSQIRKFIQLNIQKPVQFPVKVISVGNLTMGGTGKTPFVDLLCKKLYHKKIVILSRGYKRKSHGFYKVDLKREDAATFFGDEPVMLQKRNPHVQVFVSEDRVRGIRKILSAYEDIDIVILDDALQNFRIVKNLEFAIVDLTEKTENYKMVPEGRARMLPEDLNDSTFVIYTKVDLSQNIQWIEGKLSSFASAKLKYSRPHFPSHIPQGESVYLISGIGKPKNFESLMGTQYRIEKHFIFPDHYHYTEKDIAEIRSQIGSLPVLTTQKDFVKLQKWNESLKLYEVSVDFEFVENENLFLEVLKRSVLS